MRGQQATGEDFFRILEGYGGEVSGLREEYFLP
jgi:hypothetical protein